MRLVHSTSWGSADAPLFELRLAGIAVDPRDRLYAVGDASVKRFTTDGQVDAEFELESLGWSLCAEAETIWVGFEGKIGRFTPEGKLVTIIADESRLGRVTAIAGDSGQLLVADATNRTLHRYTHAGQWLGNVGTEANTRGFMIPNGVLDLDTDFSSHTVLVAHPQKHRVERYDWEGVLKEKWGRFGMHDPADFGGCCNPTNIAVSRTGLVAVSEKAPPRVKLFDSTGNFLSDSGPEIFDQNTKNIDLAFGASGRLFATDPLHRFIEVFEVLAD